MEYEYQNNAHCFISTSDRVLAMEKSDFFAVNKYPLLDIPAALALVGNAAFLNNLLSLMIKEFIPQEINAINSAYEQKDWHKLVDLIHKMKGGTIYCGTTRLKHACNYLECYYQQGHSLLLEELYKQYCTVITDTSIEISHWLEQQKAQEC